MEKTEKGSLAPKANGSIMSEDRELVKLTKRNFGLYKEKTLFYTTGGSFAAEAWVASGGENCGDVLGRTFNAITADDGKTYNIGKENVSPVNEGDLPRLFEQACPAFKLIVEIESKLKRGPRTYIEWHGKWRDYISYLLEDYTYKELREYLLENFCIEK